MNNKLTEEEVLKKAVEVLDKCPKVNEPDTFILVYNGHPIKLRSGKSSWKKRNHATSAFSNQIGMFYKYRDGWSSGEVTKLLQEKGILEVVKIN